MWNARAEAIEFVAASAHLLAPLQVPVSAAVSTLRWLRCQSKSREDRSRSRLAQKDLIFSSYSILDPLEL
jgi:hypothetical protein